MTTHAVMALKWKLKQKRVWFETGWKGGKIEEIKQKQKRLRGTLILKE